MWWAGSFDSRDSALGRLLFSRAPDGTVAPSGAATPDDGAAIARFTALAGEAPGCISVERSELDRAEPLGQHAARGAAR